MSEGHADFHSYMKQQLITYIKVEMKKGTSLEEIETALLDVGHHKNVINECFTEIKAEEAGKETDTPKIKGDMVEEMKSSIKDFFGQLTQKETKEIKKERTEDEEVQIIEEAVQEVKAEKRTYILEGILFFLYLLALVILVIFTSGSTGDELVLVIAGFAASFINTFVSFAAINLAPNVPIYVFIPVIISGLFYAAGTFGGIGIYKDMDMESLGIVNVVISLIFNILIVNTLFLRPKNEKIEPKSDENLTSDENQKIEEQEEIIETQDNDEVQETDTVKSSHIQALREMSSKNELTRRLIQKTPKRSPQQIIYIEQTVEHFLAAVNEMSDNLKDEHDQLSTVLLQYVNSVLNDVQGLSESIGRWRDLLKKLAPEDLVSAKGQRALLSIEKEMHEMDFNERGKIRDRLKRDLSRKKLISDSQKRIAAINSSLKMFHTTLGQLHKSISKLAVQDISQGRSATADVKKVQEHLASLDKQIEGIKVHEPLDKHMEKESVTRILDDIQNIAEGTKMFIGIYDNIRKLNDNFPEGPPSPAQVRRRFLGLHTQFSKHIDLERQLRSKLMEIIHDIEVRQIEHDDIKQTLNDMESSIEKLKSEIKCSI